MTELAELNISKFDYEARINQYIGFTLPNQRAKKDLDMKAHHNEAVEQYDAKRKALTTQKHPDKERKSLKKRVKGMQCALLKMRQDYEKFEEGSFIPPKVERVKHLWGNNEVLLKCRSSADLLAIDSRVTRNCYLVYQIVNVFPVDQFKRTPGFIGITVPMARKGDASNFKYGVFVSKLKVLIAKYIVRINETKAAVLKMKPAVLGNTETLGGFISSIESLVYPPLSLPLSISSSLVCLSVWSGIACVVI